MVDLDHILDRAKQSPFYKEKLKGITQFSEAPITTKRDLREGYPFAFLATTQEDLVSYHESSGSEGRPTSSYFTKNDWDDVAERFLRNGVGLSKKDVFFIKTPYSMVTTAHQAQRAAERVGALIVPGDNRSKNMPYSRVVQLLKDLKVTVTWSLPTELLLWAVAAEKHGLDPKDAFPELRAFWIAGEPLSTGRKKMISKLFGRKPIFEDYGSTETGSLAGECTQGTLHAWSDRVLFEVLDPQTQKISSEGKGLLLVTPLFREGMPLVRYLLEDEVVIQKHDCACGSLLPQIQVLGRSASFLTIQDRVIQPLGIEDLVYETGLPYDLKFWRMLRNGDECTIELTANQGAECATQIVEAFREKLGLVVSARALPVEVFVPPSLLLEKLKFSKPQFIFEKREPRVSVGQYF